jgi:crotonobetainyl-CoA:carnitine CoA-transferase CaiB-like acyl-CoA transferase
MLGAFAMLAGITSARATGAGCQMELAQSDAAAYMDWYRIETWRAYERDEETVTGNPADNYERRPPGLAGMWDGVRYQIYESSDGHVLFMASEQAFWKNFAAGVDRLDLFEKYPGSTYADHAKGNKELQTELRDIFGQKTSREWIAFGEEHNTPIAPVYNAQTAPSDPQFQHRLPFFTVDDLGAEQLPLPVNVIGQERAVPTKAPEVGQNTEEVMMEVLGLDTEDVAAMRERGTFG